VRRIGCAANQLVAMGYTGVRRYAEGKQDWQEAGLPLEAEVPASVTRHVKAWVVG